MKTFRSIVYICKFIWKADKKGVYWLITYTIWNIIPTGYNVLIYKLLIDSITEKKSLFVVLSIVILYALIRFINTMFGSFIYGLRVNKMELNVSKYMNNILLNKCSKFDMECYDNPEFYDRINKAIGQVDNTMNVFWQVQRLINNIIYTIIGITIIILLDPIMIGVALLAGVIFYIMDIKFIKIRYQANEEMVPINRKVGYFRGLLFDKKTISDIKQYNKFISLILNKYNKSVDEKNDISIKLANKNLRKDLKSQIIAVTLMTLFPYVYLAYRSYKLIITVGDIPAMVNSFNLITNGISDISREISNLKESSLYIEHLRFILEYEPKIEIDKGGEILSKIEKIEFKNINFKYPNNTENILENINILINKGNKIAIVGINGAGKTTLIKLLLRYYDPTEGEVLINDIPIKSYNVISLRENFATMFQEFQPYTLSIAEIISCMEKNNDEEKIHEIIKDIGLHEKIDAHEKGINAEYSRMFNEDGMIFSGGEIQKLFIARMLYKNSNVYILDEPSSSLDPISEYEINQVTFESAKEKTVILISHRLSTTRNADKIYLIDNKAICESGTHSELLKANGKYAQLFNIQAEQYKNEEKDN